MNSKQRRILKRKFRYHHITRYSFLHPNHHDLFKWCDNQFGKDTWDYEIQWPDSVVYKFKYAEHRTWFLINID